MEKFKVVIAEECKDFETRVNELLAQNYKLINANSGVVNNPWGSSNVIYQAFLLKENVREEDPFIAEEMKKYLERYKVQSGVDNDTKQ